jgi:hypothetical protein
MISDNSGPSRRVVVTFRGGPCEGTVVLGEGKSSQHTTAAMAYRRYRDAPGSIVGCHIWDGLCESEEPADYYTVVDANEANGTLDLVCDYGGQKAE